MNIETFFYSIVNNKVIFVLLSASDENSLFNKLQEYEINNNELMVVAEELLINAKEHGSAPVHIYLNKMMDYVYFAISDQGKGIHKTIPKNANLKDTENKNTSSIIRLSLEEGITGTGVKGRGIGLYLLSDFCKKTDSEIIVSSNSGLVYQQKDIFYTKEDKSINVTGMIICLKAKL